MGQSDVDTLDLIATLRAERKPFALATVVRTAAATSAKPGAKAVVTEDGEVHGWIGGGCAQGAVRKAALAALGDNKTRLISVQPKETLEAEGLARGEARDGVEYHPSVCPSGGTLDVFIEPMLPRPAVVICGGSPVARAIADLAPRIGFSVTVCARAEDLPAFPAADERVAGPSVPPEAEGERFVVIATQGKGDFGALKTAVESDARYVAFIGSRRKMATMRERLIAEGCSPERAEAVRAPAGLDIGAITPEEIALSVLAEVIEVRRQGERMAEPGKPSAE